MNHTDQEELRILRQIVRDQIAPSGIVVSVEALQATTNQKYLEGFSDCATQLGDYFNDPDGAFHQIAYIRRLFDSAVKIYKYAEGEKQRIGLREQRDLLIVKIALLQKLYKQEGRPAESYELVSHATHFLNALDTYIDTGDATNLEKFVADDGATLEVLTKKQVNTLANRGRDRDPGRQYIADRAQEVATQRGNKWTPIAVAMFEELRDQANRDEIEELAFGLLLANGCDSDGNPIRRQIGVYVKECVRSLKD